MTHQGFASRLGRSPFVRSRLVLSGAALVMATGCLFGDMKPKKAGGNAGQAGIAGWQNGTTMGNGQESAIGGTRGSSNDALDYGGAASGGGTTTTNTATRSSIGGANQGGAATNKDATEVVGGVGTSSGTSSPGIGGAVTNGGTSENGPAAATGGTAPSGGAATVAIAGSPTSGGAANTGGKGGVDGAAVTGGTRATGGSPVTGGAPTGGATLAGGTRATGGALPTGGKPATGGSTAVSTEIRRPCKAGPLACGLTSSDSCCATINMLGGTYPMGRSDATDISARKDTGDAYPDASTSTEETPQHDVMVSSFALDKYEVTVGRFRQFVNDYAKWHDTDGNPKEGAGQNPNNPVSPNPTGWSEGWALTAKADLLTNLKKKTECNWTDTATTNEAYPINCVSWYEAFAYCIWDGGRLPTEAEWEYAAAGGQANRLYPWGTDDPGTTHANYSGNGNKPTIAVGSYPAGTGLFGHMDLAGSMREWVFDWYQETYYGTTGMLCENCANVDSSLSERVLRGGSWSLIASSLRAASRNKYSPDGSGSGSGFRCARPTQ